MRQFDRATLRKALTAVAWIVALVFALPGAARADDTISVLPGSVEIDGWLGLRVAVAMQTSAATAGGTVQIAPANVQVAVQFVPPDYAGGVSPAPANLSLGNLGIYFTIEVHQKHAGGGKDQNPSVVIAAFGCGMGTFNPGDSRIYSGISCENTPMTFSNSNEIYKVQIPPQYLDQNKYEIISRANTVYTPILQGQQPIGPQLRNASQKLAVVNTADLNALCPQAQNGAAADWTKCPYGELRAKRFNAFAEYIAPVGGGALRPDQLAFWVRADQAAGDVALVANFSFGSPDQTNPALGTVSCNVGPMEAGQVLVYQGVSCNWPSQPITIPSGPGQLLASYSVVYTGNVTCTSQPVPLQPLPQPTSTGALQGLAFLPDSKGHYDPANGCDRPNRKSVRATAK